MSKKTDPETDHSKEYAILQRICEEMYPIVAGVMGIESPPPLLFEAVINTSRLAGYNPLKHEIKMNLATILHKKGVADHLKNLVSYENIQSIGPKMTHEDLYDGTREALQISEAFIKHEICTLLAHELIHSARDNLKRDPIMRLLPLVVPLLVTIITSDFIYNERYSQDPNLIIVANLFLSMFAILGPQLINFAIYRGREFDAAAGAEFIMQTYFPDFDTAQKPTLPHDYQGAVQELFGENYQQVLSQDSLKDLREALKDDKSRNALHLFILAVLDIFKIHPSSERQALYTKAFINRMKTDPDAFAKWLRVKETEPNIAP
jgi:hypothetical protein